MKILMVTPRPPQAQAAGGDVRVMYAQITGLLPRHEITLVTLAGPDSHHCDALEHLRRLGVEVHDVWHTHAKGIRLWKRRWWLAKTWLCSKYPWLMVLSWDPRVQLVLDRLLSQQSFDLVAVEEAESGMYRYRTETPIVFTEHEVRHPRSVNWHGWKKQNVVRWALSEADWQRWRNYQRDVWQQFDRIQFFTARDAAAVQWIAPDIANRVRINPFGIELPPPADHSREEPGTIVFVGSFSHFPNVDAALWLGKEIMPLLRACYPGVRLTIIGSSPPPAVQALATDDIVVTGFVPEVEPYLERAAVILAPVRIGGGQRVKVLHGMAVGKAVVTTPLGAQGLSIAGVQPPLTIAEDAEGIARATAALLAADNMRWDLGYRARAFVAEYFSPDAYVKRIEAIYSELQPLAAYNELQPVD